MGHTYTALHYHVVFGTKGRAPSIQPDVQMRLHEYIGGMLYLLDYRDDSMHVIDPVGQRFLSTLEIGFNNTVTAEAVADGDASERGQS